MAADIKVSNLFNGIYFMNMSNAMTSLSVLNLRIPGSRVLRYSITLVFENTL